MSRGVAQPAGSVSVDSAPTPTGQAIFPGFDGLRAIAALLVVVVHASFTTGFTTRTAADGSYSSPWGAYTARGEIGVAVFFLISGFLLYRPFVGAHLSGRRAPALGPYLIRRLSRIVPLFWFALVVTVAVLGWHVVHGLPGLLECAFFLQSYRGQWALQGIDQAWTLDIEVAFYLTLPVWAWLVGRRPRTPERQLRVELLSLVGLYLGSVALHAALATQHSGWAEAWHGWLPVWWNLFALGMGLAVVSTWYARQGRTPRWATRTGSATACWLVALFLYWLVSRHLGMSRSPLHGRTVGSDLVEHLFYGLFALFLIMPAIFVPVGRGWVQRFLSCRTMAFLGLVSYGVYLWHQLVIAQLVAWTPWRIFQISLIEFVPTVAVVTVLLAGVTYAVVERPFIARGHDWARRWRERAAGIAPTAADRRATAAVLGQAVADPRAADQVDRPGEPAAVSPDGR